jgi:3-hydroxyacyl-CoA dehydrogenase/enoyl-CoA hydratase/3-hydroxybutyryl-CoA epimerase
MHRISGCVEYTGFGRLDAVIEAVVEDMEIKKKVLREIEDHVPDDCLICTNTSSLSIDEMATALRRPERFIGLHFFNPVNRMQLVEVVACKASSAEAVARGAALVKQMGKLPLVVGACPGFLVNRILLPYIVEAARMFEEGVTVEQIDAALERFGMPMGPLALADEVGLDVGVKVAKVLEGAYGARMHVPPGLARVADEGLKGKKSGKGFYVYHGKKKHANADARRIAVNGHADHPVHLSDEEIVDRAVLSMVNEAARCLEEGVASRTDDVDAAMVLGTGFAPFRGGLLQYADERGMKGIVERLHEFETRFGDRFAPAPLLEKVASNGGNLLKHMQERESTT